MATWRRVDPVGFPRVITGAMLVIGVTFALVTTPGVALSGEWLGAAVFFGFLTLWLGFAWRMHRTGVYVNHEALRLVHILRTRTLPWAEVAEIYSATAMLGARPTSRNAIWVRLRDGSRIESPVQCRADWLGISMHGNAGRVLSPAGFDETLIELQDAHRRAIGR
ncbi:MAG TPA: hypothetical protein VF062_11385 [Candidatus Limnocylindrales bacterium]